MYTDIFHCKQCNHSKVNLECLEPSFTLCSRYETSCCEGMLHAVHNLPTTCLATLPLKLQGKLYLCSVSCNTSFDFGAFANHVLQYFVQTTKVYCPLLVDFYNFIFRSLLLHSPDLLNQLFINFSTSHQVRSHLFKV